MTIKEMIEELEWYKLHRGSDNDSVTFIYNPMTGIVCAKIENCSKSDHEHILFDDRCYCIAKANLD